MVGFIIAYAAIACICCGVFFARTPDKPNMDVIMAVVWPVALLLIVGFNVGLRAERWLK